ncbi:MAG: glycoside hydrolase family 16 protein [Acidimicrobiales bacterium]
MGQGLAYGAFAVLAAAGTIAALAAGGPTVVSAIEPGPAPSAPSTAPPPATTATTSSLVRPPTSVPLAETTRSSTPEPTTTSGPPDGWRLVWSDEFEVFDASKWSVEHSTYGHGNGELQCYQASNVVVNDGLLRLIATDTPTVCPRNEARNYTSGMVRSSGLADWTYGRFEVRARFPSGSGLWPAAWLSPTDSVYGAWPRSGELDIVEALGHADDRVVGSLHWMGPKGHELANREYFLPHGTGFNDDFHTFAVVWEPDRIVWFVDDVEYHRVDAWPSTVGPAPAPFDQPFYLKLNLAVGGGAAGLPDDSTSFPATYEIDWIRVYQR